MVRVMSPEHARQLSEINRRDIIEKDILPEHLLLLEAAVERGDTFFKCYPYRDKNYYHSYNEHLTLFGQLSGLDEKFYRSIIAFKELGYGIDVCGLELDIENELGMYSGRLNKLKKAPTIIVSFDEGVVNA